MKNNEIFSQNQNLENTPTPIVEKVSKKTIKKQIKQNSIDEVDEIIKQYLALSPVEKQIVKNNLFRK